MLEKELTWMTAQFDSSSDQVAWEYHPVHTQQDSYNLKQK